MPESPRWLLCKGRVSEVKQILQSAARFNGRDLPDNLDKYLKPPCNAQESASGVVELFRTKYLRRVTFCFLCIWFTMNLVYYGLVLNMNSFGGNIYVNSVSFPLFYIFVYFCVFSDVWSTKEEARRRKSRLRKPTTSRCRRRPFPALRPTHLQRNSASD